MSRFLPIIVALILAVYALIDCLQADPAEIRGPRRSIWIALIVLLPIAGPVAWLVAQRGRKTGRRPRPRRPVAPPVAPDDNPEFLSQLRDLDEQHEEMLTQWEADLKRREQEMRDDGDDTGDDPTRG